MKENPSLRPTLLDSFRLTREPFAILESRIYTLSRTAEAGRDYCECLGEKYSLVESDEMKIFRDELLSARRKEVEDYMAWVINFKLAGKLKDTAKRLSSKADAYSSLRAHFATGFLERVLDEIGRDKSAIKPEKIEPDLSMDSYPSLDMLVSMETCIRKLIPPHGIVCFNSHTYSVDYTAKESIGVMHFKKRKFQLNPLGELSDLARRYEAELIGDIERHALAHGEKFREQIRDLNSKLALYEIKEKERKKKNEKMGYDALDNNRYLIYVVIPPYIFQRGGKYYVFGEGNDGKSKRVEIGTILDIGISSISIEGPPIVLNIPYFHPFVHTEEEHEGLICFDGPERWEALGIKFLPNHYSAGDPSLPGKIAAMLMESVNSLTLGYVGDKVNPVNLMPRFTPIASSHPEAMQYARRNGIDPRRIFNN